MTERIRRFAIIIWLAIITASYLRLFPVNALVNGLPSLAGLHISLAGYMAPLTYFILFAVSVAGWGIRLFKNTKLSNIEIFVFSSGTGIGITSLFLLLLNFFSLLNRNSIFLLIATGTVLFLTNIKFRPFTVARQLWLLLLVSLPPLLSTLIAALAPPTLFDSLVYHLALPEKYLLAGGMQFVQSNIFFSFPQNMEMLFQAGLAAGSDISANLAHWYFLPLTGLALFAFARRFWGGYTGIAAAAVWMFSPAVMFLATGTYIDLALAFFVVLAFYALMLWQQDNNNSWIIVSGFAAGIALGTKYTAAIPAVILAGVFIAGSKKLKPAVVFSVVLFAAFSPWLLKNLVFIHNPIAPWGAALFQNSMISAEQAANYFKHISDHGMPIQTLKGFLVLPWNLTAYGFRYGGGFDMPGPVFLLFLPVLFFYGKIDRITRYLLVFSLVFAAFWLFSGKVLRFLLPIIPFLCLLTAKGIIQSLKDRPNKLAVFVLLSAVFLHNLLLFHWTMAEIDPYSPVLKNETRESYLGRKLNYYPAVSKCLNNLPDNSKVLFLGETRGYYCRKASVVPTVFDKHPLIAAANASDTPGRLFDVLARGGFTHIFVNNYEFSRLGLEKEFTDKGLACFRKFKKIHMKEIYKDLYCEAFAIKDK